MIGKHSFAVLDRPFDGAFFGGFEVRVAEDGGAAEVDAAGMLPLIWRVRSRLAVPEWRNWYTHQAQNLARFTPHVGSSPTFGTNIFTPKLVKFHPCFATKILP